MEKFSIQTEHVPGGGGTACYKQRNTVPLKSKIKQGKPPSASQGRSPPGRCSAPLRMLPSGGNCFFQTGGRGVKKIPDDPQDALGMLFYSGCEFCGPYTNQPYFYVLVQGSQGTFYSSTVFKDNPSRCLYIKLRKYMYKG